MGGAAIGQMLPAPISCRHGSAICRRPWFAFTSCSPREICSCKLCAVTCGEVWCRVVPCCDVWCDIVWCNTMPILISCHGMSSAFMSGLDRAPG